MTDFHRTVIMNSDTDILLEGIDSKQGSDTIKFASWATLTIGNGLTRGTSRGKKNDVAIGGTVTFSEYF